MKAQRGEKTQTCHDDKSGPSYLGILRKIVSAFFFFFVSLVTSFHSNASTKADDCKVANKYSHD
jgi:hypothetical protein